MQARLTDRDRDEIGRPRNARPRDATGRPLPRDASGVPLVGDKAISDVDDALARARRALDDGNPFAAHECFEWAWRHCPDDERDSWQGLAQVAAGLTHLQRGNTVGARRLLRRGADRLANDDPWVQRGVDLTAARETALRAADRLERGDVVDVSEFRFLAG